jgi:hypothetical protein
MGLRIEQALRYFCDRQMMDLDTTDGFLSLSEREILEENERHWAAFQGW